MPGVGGWVFKPDITGKEAPVTWEDMKTWGVKGMTWCSQRQRSCLPEYLSWEGTKSANTEGNPNSHCPCKPREDSSWHVRLVFRPCPCYCQEKNPFHFRVIKMLIDVLLTHSTEPHRFYNSSKHLQVVTCVRLSRQKWFKTLCTELLGRHIIP